MRNPEIIRKRIYQLDALVLQVATWHFLGKKVVFTNGCFDILHEGHIYSLSQASKEADFLIVAVNSDASVKKLKGPGRPVNNAQSRALLLASLIMVDAVFIFEEETPVEVIRKLKPDVLVKGGDYTVDQIAGAKDVIANGGRVVINPLLPGISTTSIIGSLRNS